jgi:hypothetical protein
MGNSNSTPPKINYNITISKLSADNNATSQILYTNLTESLNDAQDFILHKMERTFIDDWFQRNKTIIDEQERSKYNADAEREVPVTKWVRKPKPPKIRLFLNRNSDLDYDFDSDSDGEYVFSHYTSNPRPYNYYIKQGFDNCNNLANFFEETHYSSHTKSGIEYFIDFIKVINEVNVNEQFPLQIELKTINGDFSIK